MAWIMDDNDDDDGNPASYSANLGKDHGSEFEVRLAFTAVVSCLNCHKQPPKQITKNSQKSKLLSKLGKICIYLHLLISPHASLPISEVCMWRQSHGPRNASSGWYTVWSIKSCSGPELGGSWNANFIPFSIRHSSTQQQLLENSRET